MELSEQKKRLILIGCGAVILLAIFAAVWSGSANREEEGTSSPAASSQWIPDNMLLVEDLYEGETLIPKFELPKSSLDPEGFQEEGGIIRYDSPTAKLGVDVSEHQGSIDWQAVKGAGVDFAILRLGYRGLTQGLLNEDETFAQNYDNAKEAGLEIGVYFFSQAISEEEAREEAEFVLKVLDGRELSLPVTFDWEPPTPTEELYKEDLRAYGCTGGQVTAFSKAFCETIKEGGYTPCVYTNKTMAYEFFDLETLGDYELWYAEYQKAPSLYYAFQLWQYTDCANIPGIEGGVDLDIRF